MTIAAPASAGVTLHPEELHQFQEIMYQEAGIRLPDGKHSLVQGRLQSRLAVLGYQTFSAYLQYIAQPEQKRERKWCIEQLTTNETYFFRHKEHWDMILNTILPEHEQRTRGRPFKAWSAACSTGEEPYSLAMLLDTVRKQGQTFQITASDINQQVIQRAQRGMYDSYSLQKATPQCQQQYFRKHNDGTMEVIPEIRRIVRFRSHNLTMPPPVKQQDLVMARNVLIYFDKKSKQRAVNLLASCIKPGGWLILGGAESLGGSNPAFRYHAPAIYQRTNQEVSLG